MRKNLVQSFILLSILTGIYFSCSKGGDSGGTNPPPPPNPCAGVTVAVTGAVTDAASGQSNGSITATATGGTGFTFKIGSGAYQSSGTFGNLAAGNYVITAKNSNGCEGAASFTVATINACNGVTITVSAATTVATPCSAPNTGTITVTASGSTGLTYSINGSTFQAGNVFSNVAPGNYTVTVKNANGCAQTASATVSAAPAGPLFSAVKTIIQNNCTSCHSGASPIGGKDWSVDCNVVTNGANIKARTVDQAGTASQMPQPPNSALSLADRQKITDWINAGGKYSD
jgi:hypothetical protein